MRNTLILMTLGAVAAAAVPAAADDRYYYDNNHHRHYYHGNRAQDCRRSNGTTGTIAGAVGGGLIGNAVGGGTLGTLAGAGGGALLGRHIDQRHDAAENRRNGC